VTDWSAWHAEYDDPDSYLVHRLRIVQGEIAAWLAAQPDGPLRAVAACAGEGRDLLPVLAAAPDGKRVRARLVELDPVLAARAEDTARAAGLDVEVVRGDAGLTDTYAGAVPAGLVLMCGVFGNIPDDDIPRTVGTLPSLCADGATVIWTRTRRAPDLTPAVRRWFAEAGFAEVAWHAPEGEEFSVGVHRLTAPPRPLETGRRMFAFGP
jgi:hypothetical protein